MSAAVTFANLLFLSGQVPDDRTQDAAGQTRQVLVMVIAASS
ncbi:RidA family protein [Pseudomonas lopnurensis]|nr:hypothetical protein [Pseudomonas lopnurensis]